jgi:hypothetical protein
VYFNVVQHIFYLSVVNLRHVYSALTESANKVQHFLE